MRILGIDPGTGKLGWGVVDCEGSRVKCVKYGCVTTPAHTPLSERLVAIFEEIKKIISKYKPDKMAVEKLFFSQSTTTAMSVSEARGVVMLCAALEKIPALEYTPLQVKQAMTGYGRADKGQIQNMVKAILSMDHIPKPDDAADALAIAITCSVMGNCLIK